MSLIDLMVIIIMLILCGIGLYYSAQKFGWTAVGKACGGVFVLNSIFMVFVYFREKKSLKESYLKGHVEKQHYINQVGKTFFKKHHPDESLD